MNQRKLKKYQIIEAECKELVPDGLGLSHISREFDERLKPLTGFIWGVLPGEKFLAKVIKAKSNHFHAVLLKKDEVPDNWQSFTKHIEEPVYTAKDLPFIRKKNQGADGFATSEKFTSINDEDSQKSTAQGFVHETWALYKVSPERVDEQCENFVECGGCKLLHLSYEDTLAYKKKWLESQLNHNKIKYDTIDIIEAPKKYHYRNHVQVHINKFKDRGFFSPGSYRTVKFPENKNIEFDECDSGDNHHHTHQINRGCLIFDQKLFDDNFPKELELERCVRSRIDVLTNKVKHWSLYSKKDKADFFDYTIEFPKNSTTTITIPNDAFYQVNSLFLPIWLTKIKELILTQLSSAIESKQQLNVLELFSGFGFISRMLSFEFNLSSLGIDILKPKSFESVKIINDKNGKPSLKQFKKNYIQQDLTVLNEIDNKYKSKIKENSFDFIMLNPPRAGFIPEQITYLFEELIHPHPNFIIYSSCNSATFARDMVIFQENNYEIKDIDLMDFFPWTSHFEILSLLILK